MSIVVHQASAVHQALGYITAPSGRGTRQQKMAPQGRSGVGFVVTLATATTNCSENERFASAKLTYFNEAVAHLFGVSQDVGRFCCLLVLATVLGLFALKPNSTR